MAKTNEELNELKKRVEELNKDLAELTEEELSVVFGGQTDGGDFPWPIPGPFEPVVHEVCKYKRICNYTSNVGCPNYREGLICKYTELN